MSGPRRVAWWWLAAFAAIGLALMLALTPWGAVVSAPPGLVQRAFGAKLVARANAFATEIAPVT
jgi:4-hydroxybenzoate polyprenyltransferase